MAAEFRDLARRATELVEDGRTKGVQMRSVGGVAIWERLPDELRPAYERVREEPKDLDLVAPQGTSSDEIKAVFVARGYAPDERLIAWRGDERHQYFELDEGGRPVVDIDVFLGLPPACHKFDLPGEEFGRGGVALSSTELLLQKLQIVETTGKDLTDIAFLLLANPASLNGAGIDSARVAGLLSRDWGFHYTATRNLERVEAVAAEKMDQTSEGAVRDRIAALRDEIDGAPKSRKWKMRAKVGTRVSWYEEVEELDR
ncbi:MAG TPA: hypothetical protein VMF31_06210 [Solirubrobacterales bacterium]|nr:hypothetical protein [Solirubrobacterales bacterium]